MILVKSEDLEKAKIALCTPLLFFDFLLAKLPLFDLFDDFDVIKSLWCLLMLLNLWIYVPTFLWDYYESLLL